MENNNPPPISTEEWKEYQSWVHGKAGLLDPEEQKKFDEEFPGVSKPIKFIEMSKSDELEWLVNDVLCDMCYADYHRTLQDLGKRTSDERGV